MLALNEVMNRGKEFRSIIDRYNDAKGEDCQETP